MNRSTDWQIKVWNNGRVALPATGLKTMSIDWSYAGGSSQLTVSFFADQSFCNLQRFIGNTTVEYSSISYPENKTIIENASLQSFNLNYESETDMLVEITWDFMFGDSDGNPTTYPEYLEFRDQMTSAHFCEEQKPINWAQFGF
jgi:hypothetical protein